jgi:hypothetical protein
MGELVGQQKLLPMKFTASPAPLWTTFIAVILH